MAGEMFFWREKQLLKILRAPSNLFTRNGYRLEER